MNELLNRWVIKSRLKMFINADSRNRSGSLFHRSGTTNPKAAALFGTRRCNSRSLGSRKRLSRHFGWISLHRYAGAVPFMHLYTRTISLYVIRHSTGNQCSCFNTGVMCSRMDVLQPFHLGIREIGKQGVAVVQSRCYESLLLLLLRSLLHLLWYNGG